METCISKVTMKLTHLLNNVSPTEAAHRSFLYTPDDTPAMGFLLGGATN